MLLFSFRSRGRIAIEEARFVGLRVARALERCDLFEQFLDSLVQPMVLLFEELRSLLCDVEIIDLRDLEPHWRQDRSDAVLRNRTLLVPAAEHRFADSKPAGTVVP